MSVESPLSPGQDIGPFTILREIGRGSWAIVYDAVHRTSREVVALKWMLDASTTPALKREFRIARGLSHPHLVRLHEMYQEPLGAFFTMDRVLGGDIVTRCQRVRDVEARLKLVRRLFADLAAALEHLHGAAVVHRDIKPANVLVDSSDHVVVVDFGLAESVGAPGTKGFSGTFAYASPERLRGHRATPSSDWYAFGVLLFEALVGALPYSRNTNAALMARLEGKRVEVRSKIPRPADDLAPLIEHLLEPTPALRAEAPVVLRALGRTPSRSRRGGFVGREDARAWLDERVRAGGAIAVTGASGMGKTALVRAVSDGLGPEFILLRSQCHPRENVPFNYL
jgi:serine/threonine protein kinase